MNHRLDRSVQPPAAPTPPSRRVLFVDLARVIAILMMIQGHTLDALLSAEYRTQTAFFAWSFVRGLTSCSFFFLAGFAFVMATYGRDGQIRTSGRTPRRRFRRLAFFLAVGYLLHSPVGKLTQIGLVDAGGWRPFFAVDALQCLALTLAFLQLVALGTRTRAQFLALALCACVAAVVMTPAVWKADWEALLPGVFAAYLTPHSGSLFPLFPWSAYSLLGAVVGAGYLGCRDRAAFSIRVLGVGGVAMLIASGVGSLVPWEPLGRTDFWSSSPNQFLLRAGLVCVGVTLVAQVSKRLTRLPDVLNALAQESLLVYVVHLCIVYGSPWNRGLASWYTHALAFGPAVACVLVLWVSLTALAYVWHGCKDQKPWVAGWITQGAAVVFATGLF